jgi:hypothetical protein
MKFLFDFRKNGLYPFRFVVQSLSNIQVDVPIGFDDEVSGSRNKLLRTHFFKNSMGRRHGREQNECLEKYLLNVCFWRQGSELLSGRKSESFKKSQGSRLKEYNKGISLEDENGG